MAARSAKRLVLADLVGASVRPFLDVWELLIVALNALS